MFRRIAVAAAISFLAVTTISAVCDYLRILYQPLTEADWQGHYVLLSASPIEAAMLAYGQSLLDFLRSARPAVAVAPGIVLVLSVQLLPGHWSRHNRTRRPRVELQRIHRLGVLLAPQIRLRMKAAARSLASADPKAANASANSRPASSSNSRTAARLLFD